MRRYFLLGLLLVILTVTGCGQGKRAAPSAADTSLTMGKARGDEIVIAGSGSSVNLMRSLAKAYEEKLPGRTVEVPDSVGSAGGIKLLREGKINLAMVSRPLAASEKSGLKYQPFARSAVVFAVNSAVPIKNLSSQNIIDIYSGKVTNWQDLGGPNAKIIVMTRDQKASSRQLLVERLPGFSGLRETKTAMIITNQQIMYEALESVAYSVGWVDIGPLAENNLPFIVPDLNGVTPNAENIKRGRYPLTREFAFVSRDRPDKLSAEFLAFVFGPEGQQVMLKQGYSHL